MSDGYFRNDFLDQLRAHKYRITKLGSPSPEFEFFVVSLAEWKLCFSDKTPVIWVKADAMARMPVQELTDVLHDVARQHRWHNRERIVLVDADGTELRQSICSREGPRAAVIDAAQQRKICGARSFTGALLNVIQEQIPVASLAPYLYGGAVEGSRFFGRSHEVDQLSRSDGNFAVTGLKRIGKSSLLKEARRRLTERVEGAPVVWLDCSAFKDPGKLLEEIVSQLNPRELLRLEKVTPHSFRFLDFLKRMSKMHRGKITVFLDEIDTALVWPGDGIDLPSSLRSAADAGSCRLIVAGHGALEKEVSDNQSRLFKLLAPIRLGPFDLRDTHSIVVDPTQRLGIKVESQEEMVSKIHADTGGHPSLVQFICYELVRKAEALGSLALTLDMLAEIAGGDNYKNEFVNDFRHNTTAEDKLLVYALLLAFPEHKGSYAQEDMYGALRKNACPQSLEQIDRTCDRLCQAGFLSREGPRFRFSSPMLARYLRANYNLAFQVSVMKKGARS
jgi:hypothetical protein